MEVGAGWKLDIWHLDTDSVYNTLMELDIFLSYIYIAFQFIDNELEIRIEKLI